MKLLQFAQLVSVGITFTLASLGAYVVVDCAFNPKPEACSCTDCICCEACDCK